MTSKYVAPYFRYLRLTLERSDFGTDIITIYVGEKRKEFIIHKKLACETSEFFQAAFSGKFEEGKSNTMHMPEDHPGAFELFVKWVYRDAIPVADTRSHLNSLYYLYFLADKLCLSTLKDMTIDAIQDMAIKHDLKDELFSKDLVKAVIANTGIRVEGLRKFCVEIMAYTYVVRFDPKKDWPDTKDYYSDSEPDDNKPNLGSSDEDSEFGYSYGDNRKPYVCINTKDQKFAWEIGQGNFDFFKVFEDRLLYHSRRFRIVGKVYHAKRDPRIRKEDVVEDRCWLHCHGKDVDCRPPTINRNAKFVKDVEEFSQ